MTDSPASPSPSTGDLVRALRRARSLEGRRRGGHRRVTLMELLRALDDALLEVSSHA